MLEFCAMMDKSEALRRAIKNVGGLAGLAAPLGISEQAISQWDEVPPLRVLAVERVSGVPKEELRPDLYPVEARA
jgi:DNA-binding transcriptional regulator YdaS (Cro superfamily)